MATNLDFTFTIANSIFTIFCGVIILVLVAQKRLERHLFHYGWAIGFMLYGTEIFVSVFSTNLLITAVPATLSFILFQFSTWYLNRRKEVSLVFFPFLAVFFTLVGLGIFQLVHVEAFTLLLGTTTLYLPVAVLILIHRRLFGTSVSTLLAGWLSLYFVNIVYLVIPFEEWISDLLAILCKVIILAGILNYDFAITTQKIRVGLESDKPPISTGELEEGGMTLIMVRPGSEPPLSVVSKWMKNRIENNTRFGIETSILVLQDILSYETLRSAIWSKPELVHFFIFSQSPVNHEDFTTLKFGETEIGATITEISRRHNETKRKGEVIFIDLSILINTFGVHRAYNLVLNKMGILRMSGTSFVAVIHENIHEEQEVALFKTIADSFFITQNT